MVWGHQKEKLLEKVVGLFLVPKAVHFSHRSFHSIILYVHVKLGMVNILRVLCSSLVAHYIWFTNSYIIWRLRAKDTNRKIRTTFFIDYCVWILVPNSKQDMHSVFCGRLTSPLTSPVFTVLLLEPFLEPRMHINPVFLVFLLVSLSTVPV